MSIELFKWRALTEAVNRAITVTPFVLSKLFPQPRKRLMGARTVEIEIKEGNSKVAGFIRSGAPATVVDRDGLKVYTITLPRLSEKKTATAAELLHTSGAGQIYVGGGAVNLGSRIADQLGEDLVDLKGRIERRLELMACQALQGKVSSIDDDKAQFEADYGFLATHKITETGTQLWSTPKIDLVKKIRQYKRVVLKDSGKSVNTAIVGPDVAEALFANEGILKYLHNNNLQVGRLNMDGNDYYLGRFLGIDWFEYSQEYQIGTTKYDFFPSNGLSMFSSQADVRLFYGPIEDFDAGGNVVTEMFSKTWDEKDPSAKWIKVESNPLPVINEPNAFLWATVV